MWICLTDDELWLIMSSQMDDHPLIRDYMWGMISLQNVLLYSHAVYNMTLPMSGWNILAYSKTISL